VEKSTLLPIQGEHTFSLTGNPTPPLILGRNLTQVNEMNINSMYQTALLWNGGLSTVHEYCWYREPSVPRLVLDRMKFFGAPPRTEEERGSMAAEMVVDSGIIYTREGAWQYRGLTGNEHQILISAIYEDLKD